MQKLLQGGLIVLLSIFIAACAGKNETDLLNEGNKFIKEKKYEEAAASFQKVIDEYPESKAAAKAMFELAKMYQGKVLKNVGEKESLKKAVEYYKRIYEKFPDSEQAPASLFMAGFIEANELKDFDAAKETYNLYLEKYPNGELADDAKIELANLGKSPEEILMEKLKNSKQ